MANLCDTVYKVTQTGSGNELESLWNTLQELEVNEKNVWLGDLAKHYGIDPEKKHCSVRGEIYWAEYDEKVRLLSFDVESAWCSCREFFEELNKALGNFLIINFREVECGCEVFNVHDEQGFFPEECLVDCSGNQFSENGEIVVDTIDDAISGWCQAMGIEQGDRSQDDMVKFIEDYEYDDEDTYYYIHPFTFE